MKYFDETQLTPFQARYGIDVPDNDYPTNKFVEKLLVRKTIRRFNTERPLDIKLIEKLITVAQSSPTSSMLQPWSVLSIRSKEAKERLLKNNAVWFEGHVPDLTNRADIPTNNTTIALLECDTLLIWMIDYTIIEAILTRPDAFVGRSDLSEKRMQSLKMSHQFDIETRGIVDTAIAAQTFACAAESLGIGVMYMGGIRDLDLDHLNVPVRCKAIFGMAIGWPSENLNTWGLKKNNPNAKVFLKPRLPQELIFHKETYKNKGQYSLDDERFEKVKLYNNIMYRFYKWHHQEWDWFDRVVKRTWRTGNRFLKLSKLKGFFIGSDQ